MAKMDIVVDIGSKFLGLGIVDRDFVSREPCVVAEEKQHIKNNYVAFGIKALQAEKNDDGSCTIIHPVQNGQIIDADAFEYLLTCSLQKILPSSAFLPKMKAYCVISCCTSDETKKIIDNIFNKLGFKKVEFVYSPVADAFSARKEIGFSSCITINMGNELTQICAVEGDKIISGVTMQWAGVQLLAKITEYARNKYNMVIGPKQADKILVNSISLYPNNMSTIRIKGVNTLKNVEEYFEISSRELYETTYEFFEKVVDIANSLFMSLPISKVEKIRSNGVVLFGGLAAVEGLEKFLVEALKMPVRLKLNSENSGVEGAKVYAEMIDSQN